MFKWFIRAGVAAAALVLVLIVALTVYLVERFHASKPLVSGELEVSGPGAAVHVIRDENGVAHIFGESDADVFFALGHTHASERFFQMDMARRYVTGRLAEMFGPDYVRADARTRTMGYARAAAEIAEAQSEETRAAVEAYVEGVNARLAEGPVAPEYALLRTSPEPWTAVDSAAIVVLFADDLAAGLGDDVERARLSGVLNGVQLDQFLAGYPEWAPTTLKDEDVRAAFGDVRVRPLPPPQTPVSQPDNLPGSNAWIVSGEHTESGLPLLANDPHLGLSTPSIWYFARLNLSYGPVIGATTPGAPFVILGRNAHGAWGYTNTGFKVIDFIERDRDSAAISARTEVIEVRGRREPVEIRVEETPEGPVLNGEWFNLGGFNPDRLVVRRSTVTAPDNRGADATFAIMRAQNWEEFVEAGRGFTAPMQNMHYANIDGTIGYTTAGLLPVRDENGDWTGFAPFDELPRILNPRGGMIASGNNLVASDAYPYPLPGSYAVYRAPRIEAMLRETPRHTLQSFAAAQMDVRSEFARRILPALLGAQPESQLGAQALARLERWNGELTADGPEALIFSAWLRVLSGAIWNDELGSAAPAFNQPRRRFIEDVLAGEASSWCNDVRTPEIETCALTAGLALDAAMAETAAAFGRNIDAWRWGEVHQAVFDHPLGNLPVLGKMFENRVPVPGDGSTVNVAHFSYASGNYDVFHAASLRAIYDLSDLNESLFMHAPGQSGHPLSPHHGDLAARWAAGEYFQIRDDWTAASPPPGARVLTLRPQ